MSTSARVLRTIVLALSATIVLTSLVIVGLFWLDRSDKVARVEETSLSSEAAKAEAVTLRARADERAQRLVNAARDVAAREQVLASAYLDCRLFDSCILVPMYESEASDSRMRHAQVEFRFQAEDELAREAEFRALAASTVHLATVSDAARADDAFTTAWRAAAASSTIAIIAVVLVFIVTRSKQPTDSGETVNATRNY